MSGICAVWCKENSERIAAKLSCVNSGLTLVEGGRVELQTDDGAGLGVSACFATQQVYRNSRVLVACDAELSNREELGCWNHGQEQIAENAKIAALLAALYERFGCDFVEKLQGSFSVILWDRQEKRIIAAVDGFGVKRLVYYNDANVVLIASRIGAVAQSADIDLNINPRAIASVLNFSCILAPETIFTRIHRLSPGTLLVASKEKVRLDKYWDMRYGVQDDSNEERLSRKLESLVEVAVATDCKGEKFSEVGAFLSGGTDSSTVVGMMSRLERGAVKTFSIGFQEQRFNELGYAELVAEKFNTDHHKYLVGPEDCFLALPQMVRSFDEPFGNSSAIPTYFCARLAAQNGVKVLLAGDGGDELFGGNERYTTDKIFEAYHTLPQQLRKRGIEPFIGWMPIQGGLVGKARRYVKHANLRGIDRLTHHQFLCAHAPADVFQADFLEALTDYRVLEIPSGYYEKAPAREHLDRLLYVDVKITLGDNDLPKVTCMSELAGVQSRFPFLNRPLAEFSGCIPANLKVKGFQKRYLFKKAFRDLLPREVIKKKKHGFGIPVATWLKSDSKMREFSRDILFSARAFERGYFRRGLIEQLFRDHEADHTTYYGDMLWIFLTLELWHRQVVDEPPRMTA